MITATPLARNSDPIQSHEAADRAARFGGSHRQRIIEALRRFGPQTAHEIASRVGLDPVQVDRRVHELRKACEARAHCSCINGERVEIKRATPSGGMAQVWEAT